MFPILISMIMKFLSMGLITTRLVLVLFVKKIMEVKIMIQRRTKMKKSIDKKIFSRTAKKTAKINIVENLQY